VGHIYSREGRKHDVKTKEMRSVVVRASHREQPVSTRVVEMSLPLICADSSSLKVMFTFGRRESKLSEKTNVLALLCTEFAEIP
jgi:hypothetical protein